MIKPKLPPFKNWALQNFPFIEDDFDSLTNYQLYSKIVEYIKKVDIYMKGVNEFLTEVDNYFNNLDVQEEIDNKLDEMAESGQLQEIVSEYLNSKAIFGFDTVNDMKEATNLIIGSYAKTMGYYSVNDGGGATYRIREITNEDVVDEMTILAMDDENLIAELIVNNKEYNIASLGCNSSTDLSDEIQALLDRLEDNVTLIVPDGTYILDIILKNKYTTIKGNGTIKGSITIDTTIVDNVLNECYINIEDINLTKNENEYAIKLETGRNFKIKNINIDDSFTYGIYYNKQSSFAQRIAKGIITNCIIYADNGIYLSDTNVLGCADITFSNNTLYSSICNVYLDGVDGFKDSTNTYFMPGYNKQDQNKTYNIKANRINWLTINGSTLFEAGLNGIYLTKYQNVNINNNIIGWCGQRVRSSAIYLGDYDVSGNGLYNLTHVSDNLITAPSGDGIEVTTQTGRISIDNNRLHGVGSSQYYYGETDTSNKYGIKYPLINENMFSSVTNNICENKINSLATRIFNSNNITPNSKSTAYRLTQDVEISDTFAVGRTTKTLSYSIPTGYVVNNIRIKSMNPVEHSAQYDVTIVGNVAVINNEYTSSLTTTITFEVEFVKTDSYI